MPHIVRRALVSVFDKEGIVEFCRDLAERGIEILSSGGTARLLAEHSIPVTPVAEYTGFPEMLDGRVKTLHPRIHAGILAVRDNPRHVEDLAAAGIGPLDLVVVNLYPFEKTAARERIALDEVVEMIDVGGPTLVRAAAKNHAHVGVLVDPADYATAADELRREGGLSDATRLALAAKAFRHTSDYDLAIQSYLSSVAATGQEGHGRTALPERLTLEFRKLQDLRYGENPHQSAALYRDPLAAPPALCAARQLQGKELSFNNMLDLDAALALASDLRSGACVIVKHGNPCGVGTGPEPLTAFHRAFECDPVSAFGGVIAFNRGVDARAAKALAEHFFEAVVAPVFDSEASALLARKSKLRLLETGALERPARLGLDLRRIDGGLLVQDWDRVDEAVREGRVVTDRRPTDEEWAALEFAWVVARHVKSNAIVYARSDRTIGIGAGQMSRVDSARIAIVKAQSPLAGAVMASDAFFPFRDGIDVAAEAGIGAIVQPGGSVRDDEVVAAANEHGMTMVLTGRRHFRH